MSDTDETRAASGAVTLSERGVLIEGQRIASVMSDGPRALLAHAPLVILPDAGAAWGDYRAVLEWFASSRRVFAFDWPGFGASARPTPTEFAYTLDHLTEVFGLWLDSLGVARAVLLGHGLAAGVAARYAVAHPMRALGLALGPTTEQTQVIEAERRAARKAPEHAAALAALVALWRDAQATRVHTLAQARQTRAPSLVIRGALDPLSTVAETRQAAEAMGERGGLEVTLPAAGHLPWLQQPERFSQALEGLIATAEANMVNAN